MRSFLIISVSSKERFRFPRYRTLRLTYLRRVLFWQIFAANGKDNFSCRTNKMSHSVFHVWEAAENGRTVNRATPSALHWCMTAPYLLGHFGCVDESHLAADKSIWDECWSPEAAWRSPSPHLGSVRERSLRSRLDGCRGKVTRADEQDQSCCWPPCNAGKTIAGCTGQRRRRDGEEGKWRWWSGGRGPY